MTKPLSTRAAKAIAGAFVASDPGCTLAAAARAAAGAGDHDLAHFLHDVTREINLAEDTLRRERAAAEYHALHPPIDLERMALSIFRPAGTR